MGYHTKYPVGYAHIYANPITDMYGVNFERIMSCMRISSTIIRVVGRYKNNRPMHHIINMNAYACMYK